MWERVGWGKGDTNKKTGITHPALARFTQGGITLQDRATSEGICHLVSLRAGDAKVVIDVGKIVDVFDIDTVFVAVNVHCFAEAMEFLVGPDRVYGHRRYRTADPCVVFLVESDSLFVDGK
jgi:hypothetical protein